MVRRLNLIKSHMIIFAIVCLLAIKKSFTPIKRIKIDRFVLDIKHILIWTKIHGLDKEGQKYFVDKKCNYINCYFTYNKSLFGDVRYFDVILFNAQDVSEDIIPLPSVRNTIQKYVFVSNDSSDNFPVCNKVYDSFFNWTWTYRYDSTISYHFITIFNNQYEELANRFRWESYMKPIDITLKSQFVTKSKAAVIFLDKCKSRSNREGYIKKLRNSLATYNLTIDIFGKCGEKQCKRKNMNPCFWRLRKSYYFYLAFEDSISLDYITDIVLYAYYNNAVPIVYGGAQYYKYLPPGSYLNARNLTTKVVADIMHELISNRERYYDFFRWRNYYAIAKSPTLDACKLCDELNKPYRLTVNVVYNSFRKWWNHLYKQRCELEDSNGWIFHFISSYMLGMKNTFQEKLWDRIGVFYRSY